MKTALDVIGGKWKPLILYALKSKPLRFGELKRCVPGSTQKVLTEQLRQLMGSDIVERAESPGAQVYAEYSLSTYGQTLRPVLAALAEWGTYHRERVRSGGQ